MPASDWEDYFRTCASPPSATEEQKCENAEGLMRKALSASEELLQRSTSVILQGSYKNNTNVRRESDVDVGFICSDLFYYSLPPGLTAEAAGITPSSYTYARFKDAVGGALYSYFDPASVTRGNKAFDVHANTYRVDADVAPFCRYRQYLPSGNYHEGVCLFPDNSPQTRVVNWPEQHYRNGVAKNNATSRRYKSVVRIAKAVRYDMRDEGYNTADLVTGFAIECALYNVGNGAFLCDSLYDSFHSAIDELGALTNSEAHWPYLTEVNEIKPLYNGQKWTREGMLAFLTTLSSFTA